MVSDAIRESGWSLRLHSLISGRWVYIYGRQPPCQRPGERSRLGNTQTKKIGHYIHSTGNVLLWGKSLIRIEIHFWKSRCFQGGFFPRDVDIYKVCIYKQKYALQYDASRAHSWRSRADHRADKTGLICSCRAEVSPRDSRVVTFYFG